MLFLFVIPRPPRLEILPNTTSQNDLPQYAPYIHRTPSMCRFDQVLPIPEVLHEDKVDLWPCSNLHAHTTHMYLGDTFPFPRPPPDPYLGLHRKPLVHVRLHG